MAGVKNSFGLGKGSSKSRLVADLNDEYKKLNTTLKETAKLSKDIEGSLKGSSRGGNRGGASSMSEPTPPPGPVGPSGPMGPSGPGGPGGPSGPGSGGSGSANSFNYGSAVRSMAGAALTALTSSIDDQSYVANDIARRRFGFFSGIYSRQNDNIGTIAGAKAFASMSSRGTPISPMDAANASMSGNSMGLMSGLKNYNTIINSTAGISNVLPGVGLEGGMGAVAALNQGASVNKLRMIGINVRDQNGFMRNVEDIARDLWKSLNTSKSGRTNITESDLSFSLQAGNSLAMLLDQYFGTDAVLKQAVVSYLFQFAKNNGAKVGAGYQSEIGKKELLTTGANPGITQSIGNRNTTGQANINAYTSAGVGGIQTANEVIMGFTKLATAMMPVMESLVAATTFSTTLGGAGNGAGGIIIKELIDGAKGAADVSLAGIKAIKQVALVAAVALGVGAIARNGTQQNDEYWADLIANGTLTPNSNGPGYGDPGYSDRQGTGGTGRPWITVPGASDTGETNDASTGGTSTGGTSTTVTPASTGAKPTAAQIKAARLKKVRAANPLLDSGGWFNMKAKSSNSRDWAKKFLVSGLGISEKNITNEHLSAVQEWLQHENTASSNWLGTRNNPLNTKWDMGKDLGTDYVGMTGYATEEEGITAAATTLLKANPAFGYGSIVSAFKNPKATEEQIWSTIAASSWSGDSHYNSSTGKGNFTKMDGTVININIPNATSMDPKQLADAIYEVIKDRGQVDQARGTRGYE
jgi:hypothetical protein